MKINKIFKKKPNIQRVLAKTNVIELSNEYKYLIVFDEKTGLSEVDIMDFMIVLKEEGFTGIGLYVKNRGGVQIYKRKDGKAK